MKKISILSHLSDVFEAYKKKIDLFVGKFIKLKNVVIYMLPLFDLYTKIFLDTNEGKQNVIDCLAVIINGSVEGASVESNYLDIYVSKNEDFSDSRRHTQDGFLFYKYYLDIEPKAGVKDNEFISSIANLLEELWKEDIKAVAACDFEDLLPQKGGYNPDR